MTALWLHYWLFVFLKFPAIAINDAYSHLYAQCVCVCVCKFFFFFFAAPHFHALNAADDSKIIERELLSHLNNTQLRKKALRGHCAVVIVKYSPDTMDGVRFLTTKKRSYDKAQFFLLHFCFFFFCLLCLAQTSYRNPWLSK